jgi:hypothetical protein
MQSARRRKKPKFINTFKKVLIYSFISITVVWFLISTFLSNIIEYSFAFAKDSDVLDFKNSDKYPVVLISKNSLNEVKKFDMLIYDKNSKKIHEYNFDPNIQLSYNEENVNLTEILNMSNKGSHSTQKDVISYVLKENFALNIGDIFIISESDFLKLSSVLKGNSMVWDLFSLKFWENLPLREVYLIYNFARNLEFKDIKNFEIQNVDSLDKSLRQNHLDTVIGKEGLSISVVNTTNVSGFASKISRFLNNQGGRVIDISSSREAQNESFIIYKSKSDSLEKISQTIGVSKHVPASEVGYLFPEIIKSDIVVVLGLDKEVGR